MGTPSLVAFRRSAVASGLLTAADFDRAEDSLRMAGESLPLATTRQVAEALIAAGLLNRWQASQLMNGRTRFRLGPYRVLDSIGQGGMGQVFKAEHLWMGRIVAIKVLPREKCTDDALERFSREIRTQARLDHPNLVRALDAGHDGNVYYLVTEYVPGADLRRLVRRQGKLSLGSAAHVVSQAAKGLAYAHAQGILHRDVKPGNVLVTPSGDAKLSDLGLVDTIVAGEASDFYRGKIVGTADYLCPEQVTLSHPLTAASDVYSLGCTLYYAVTGKVPFPGGTPREKAKAHCDAMPLDPRRINPELDDAFVDVLASLMEKDPRRRVATADEVIERLAPWAAGGWQSPALPAHRTPPPRGWDREAMNPLALEPTLVDVEPSDDSASQEVEAIDWLENDESQHSHVDSPSQLSQSTHPMASADEATLPLDLRPHLRLRPGLRQRAASVGRRLRDVPWVTVFLVAAGVAGGLVAIGTLVAAVAMR